ncbi:MAG: hypothetical protein JW715_07335 [Sedimentisphaerales bacterium]|nr:hypothetical protein [Sedimentisphaerales bacterium]
MKRLKIIVFILLGFLLSGCSKQSSVISFVSEEPFKPNSGAELLEKLNSHLPFNVSPENFMCRYKPDPDRFVGWIVIPTVEQKEIVKEKLKQSSTLKLLQVESLTPQMKALFKKEWKQSQTAGPPDKELNKNIEVEK